MLDRLNIPARFTGSRKSFLAVSIASFMAATFLRSAEAQVLVVPADNGIQLPNSLWEKINRDNTPIVRLFPHALANYRVTAVKGESLQGWVSRNGDQLDVKLESPNLDPINLAFLPVVAWHEISGHGFDFAHDLKPSLYVGASIDPIVSSPLENRFDRIGKLRLVTESNYYKQPDPEKQKPIIIGHPWDNWREIFASSSTVAAKFPNELITGLERNPQQAVLIANTILRTIESYVKFAQSPVSIIDLPFDRKMILELQRIGRGQVMLIKESTKVSRRSVLTFS